MICISSPSA